MTDLDFATDAIRRIADATRPPFFAKAQRVAYKIATDSLAYLEPKDAKVARQFNGSACDGCRHWHVGWDMHGNCKLDLALGTDRPMMACGSMVKRRTGKDE